MPARFGLFLLSLVLFSFVGAQAALTELEDYEAALAQAAKENKFVLLDFTGSDWCPPCKMMEKEVFSTEEFATFAAKNLVVVKLDFSPTGAKPGKFKDQHNYLAQRFQIQVFPTFVLLDPKGSPVAYEKGYQPGGAASFIKWVEATRQKAATGG